MKKNNKKLSIVIFRNNLRTFDNEPLTCSLQNDKDVVCLYPLEILNGFELGFSRCGKFRKEFIYQTLLELQKNLNKKNISLLFINDLESSLKELSLNFDIEIYFEKEAGVYEEKFEAKLKKYPYKEYYNQTLLKPFEFDYQTTFTQFKKIAQDLKVPDPIKDISYVEKNTREFRCIDKFNENIKLQNIDIIFKGGQCNALKRVDYYLDKHIHNYLETRSLIDGKDISTTFSAYLSIGALSARTVYKKLKYYEKKHGQSKSSYWIYFELLWRDFFHMILLKSKNKMFLKSGISQVSVPFKEETESFDKFFNANTGVDIIDAGVKELKQTGWLSNRQRQLLASYFTKNLGLDFRYGAAFFEKYLIDYNPASNYGNWNYQAGVGNDKSYRVFDPIKQSKQYKGKEYIKKWLNKDEQMPSFDYIKMAKEIRYSIYDNVTPKK